MVILKEAEIKKSHKKQHAPYEYYKQEITKRSEFDQCYAAFYEIPPLKSNYPFHYHEKNTELFYIIAGKGLLRTNDGDVTVEAGDVIVCPPGKESGHKLTNVSETETLRYLDVDTVNSPEVIHYPDSGKIGVVIHHQSSDFYKEESRTDYYDGE